MEKREHYQQSALSLATSEDAPSMLRMEEHEEEPLPDLSQIPSIAADPKGMRQQYASNRLAADFWNEYHLEWEFREQNGMTPVSPAEFADMRDMSDGYREPENVVWPPLMTEPPYEGRKRRDE